MRKTFFKELNYEVEAGRLEETTEIIDRAVVCREDEVVVEGRKWEITYDEDKITFDYDCGTCVLAYHFTGTYFPYSPDYVAYEILSLGIEDEDETFDSFFEPCI